MTKKMFVTSHAEAMALADRFGRTDYLPYDHIVDGQEFEVQDKCNLDNPLTRFNLYNVLENLSGQDYKHVSKYLDQVHGNNLILPCGCNVHFLFNHDEHPEVREHHGHRPKHRNLHTKTCNAHMHLEALPAKSRHKELIKLHTKAE